MDDRVKDMLKEVREFAHDVEDHALLEIFARLQRNIGEACQLQEFMPVELSVARMKGREPHVLFDAEEDQDYRETALVVQREILKRLRAGSTL